MRSGRTLLSGWRRGTAASPASPDRCPAPFVLEPASTVDSTEVCTLVRADRGFNLAKDILAECKENGWPPRMGITIARHYALRSIWTGSTDHKSRYLVRNSGGCWTNATVAIDVDVTESSAVDVRFQERVAAGRSCRLDLLKGREVSTSFGWSMPLPLVTIRTPNALLRQARRCRWPSAAKDWCSVALGGGGGTCLVGEAYTPRPLYYEYFELTTMTGAKLLMSRRMEILGSRNVRGAVPPHHWFPFCWWALVGIGT